MRRVLGALAAAAALSAALPAVAGAATSATLEATFGSGIANGWAQVERYRANNAGFAAETYPPDGRGNQTGQTATFFGGVGRPASSRFLLYQAPRALTGTKATPVLLVHGANQTADQAWANPNASGSLGCGAVTCPSTGLMQQLDGAGYRVFALGFPHRNGDGYYWAQQIHDAITQIKAKTGARQVDVIGWSKGAFNARMYASSVRKTWGTAYAGDIRKLVLLGNPNKGFDWGYRHGWSHDFVVFPECGGTLNVPAPHSSMVCYGLWRNHPELSYEGTAFPGSGQMLARWDATYPLPTAEQDWYTTYYGGTGVYTAGRGIQWAIDRDSLVSAIVRAGTPASLPTYLLCGTAPTMAGMHNEHTGPSDGAVFVASCTARDGIGNLAGTATPYVNHLGLGWESAATTQIVRWLG